MLVDNESTLLRTLDIMQCQTHARTTYLGKPKEFSERCPCCLQKCEKEKIGGNFRQEEILFLGPGLALYIQFIKLCVMIILLNTFVSTIPVLILNALGSDCESNQALLCSRSFLLRMTAVNSLTDETTFMVRSLTNSFMILVVFVAVRWSRLLMKRLKQEACNHLNEGSYAVVMQARFSNYTEENIREEIECWFTEEKRTAPTRDMQKLCKCKGEFPIEAVLFSYDLSKFDVLCAKIEEKTTEGLEGNRSEEVAQEILDLTEEIMSQERFQKTEYVVLIFRYPEQKRFLLSRLAPSFFEKNICNCNEPIIINERQANFQSAPDPRQLLWANHKAQFGREMSCRIILMGMVTGVVIACEVITLEIFYMWLFTKEEVIRSQWIAPVVALVIELGILLLWPVLEWVTKIQSRSTVFSQITSESLKGVIFGTLVSGPLLFLLFAGGISIPLWGRNGYFEVITYMGFFLIPFQFGKYLNWELIRKHWWKKKIFSLEKVSISQTEANRMFSRPDKPYYRLYSWKIRVLLWGGFVAPCVPIVWPCLLAAFIIDYLTEKLDSVYIYKQPLGMQEHLNEWNSRFLDCLPLYMSLGNLMLDIYASFQDLAKMRDVSLGLNIAMVTFGVLVAVVPIQRMDELWGCMSCNKDVEYFQNEDYRKVVSYFPSRFETENPVYKFIHEQQKQLREYPSMLEVMEEKEIKNEIKKARKNTMVTMPTIELVTPKHLDQKKEDNTYAYKFYPKKIRTPKAKTSNELVFFPNKYKSAESSASYEMDMVELSKAFPEFSRQQRIRLVEKVKESIPKL